VAHPLADPGQVNMSFLIGSNTVFSSSGVNVPRFTTAGRPASPVNGQVIYNTSTSTMEIYDGGQWRNVTAQRSFLLRTIITNGYVLGGYKDTSPWRNVNRMVHATDVMTNLGDQIDTPGAYISGASGLTKAWGWGMTSAWPGTSAAGVAFNMSTETSAGTSTNFDMRVARDDLGTLWREHYYAYIIGGGSADVDVFNMSVETMMQDLGIDSILGSSGEFYAVGGVSDEWAGWAWGGGNTRLSYASGANYRVDTGVVGGSNGQQKGINSKIGRGWMGNEGTYNGGYNLRRWNLATETNLGTVAKPIGNSGEENFDMGQAHQYMMGCYDGAQNNRGWKFNYSTESGSELGSGSLRTGVPGGSSGFCAWRG
jgi:hypothetical protein